jgi:hypothetical protein
MAATYVCFSCNDCTCIYIKYLWDVTAHYLSRFLELLLYRTCYILLLLFPIGIEIPI